MRKRTLQATRVLCMKMWFNVHIWTFVQIARLDPRAQTGLLDQRLNYVFYHLLQTSSLVLSKVAALSVYCLSYSCHTAPVTSWSLPHCVHYPQTPKPYKFRVVCYNCSICFKYNYKKRHP